MLRNCKTAKLITIGVPNPPTQKTNDNQTIQISILMRSRGQGPEEMLPTVQDRAVTECGGAGPPLCKGSSSCQNNFQV
eukprot:1104216-Amphidinium_carterae.2